MRAYSRILFQIVAGNISVLLDWSAAWQVLNSLEKQISTGNIVRLDAQCASLGSSMIVNYPLSRQEAKAMIVTLKEYVNG